MRNAANMAAAQGRRLVQGYRGQVNNGCIETEPRVGQVTDIYTEDRKCYTVCMCAQCRKYVAAAKGRRLMQGYQSQVNNGSALMQLNKTKKTYEDICVLYQWCGSSEPLSIQSIRT